MVRTITKSKAKKRAWKIFSLYIRTKGSIKDTNQCVTCERTKLIKELQAGHFIPGRHNAVLFDERNCWPQCYACNVVLGGNGPKFYKFMLGIFGQRAIDKLEELDRTNRQIKTNEFLEIEEKYKRKYEELKQLK